MGHRAGLPTVIGRWAVGGGGTRAEREAHARPCQCAGPRALTFRSPESTPALRRHESKNGRQTRGPRGCFVMSLGAKKWDPPPEIHRPAPQPRNVHWCVTPSVQLQPPSVTLQPPSVTLQPPSVTLQPPSIQLQPPAAVAPSHSSAGSGRGALRGPSCPPDLPRQTAAPGHGAHWGGGGALHTPKTAPGVHATGTGRPPVRRPSS